MFIFLASENFIHETYWAADVYVYRISVYKGVCALCVSKLIQIKLKLDEQTFFVKKKFSQFIFIEKN